MMPKGLKCRHILAGSAVALALAAPVPAIAQEQTFEFNIPAQSLDRALRAFARTSRQQILFDRALVERRRSPQLIGNYSVAQALNRLLAGSGLRYERSSRGAYILRRAAMEANPGSGEAQAGGASANSENTDAAQAGVAEILVVGSRSQNVDIRRTEDDAQPYVVFDRSAIARSQAASVDDFLRTRLPMNTTQAGAGQVVAPTNRSSVNLRGLGSNQTLVLVDGRRLPSVVSGGAQGFGQADLNSIPLASIERIEVLPSTASGIYGGGATGGVVNIITRQNYTGFELRTTYGQSFRGDAEHYRIDVNGGVNLGAFQARFSASRSHDTPLLTGERGFIERARALQDSNVPFSTLATPPLGYTPNICATATATSTTCTTTPLVFDNGTALGSSRTFVPVGYAGPGADGGAALLANAGRYNIAIPDNAAGTRAPLLNGSTVTSVSVNLRYQAASFLELYADGFWSMNRASSSVTGGLPSAVTLAADAPNNPFTTPIRVSFASPAPDFRLQAESEVLRGSLGGIVRLPYSWAAVVDYQWNRALSPSTTTLLPLRPTGTAALANGTLNVVRDLNANPIDFTPFLFPTPNLLIRPAQIDLENASVRLSGPLFRLPGGPLTATVLLERRSERAADTLQTLATSAVSTTLFPSRSQDVNSVYAELRAPVVSPSNDIPFVELLELQASIRRDAYETTAPSPSSFPVTASLPTINQVTNEVSETSYTLALRYSPVPGLLLRASHGTGFLPASVSQLTPGTPQSFSAANAAALIDRKRGGAPGSVGAFIQTTGGNPDLTPEQSRSWSIGAVLTPSFLRGFRFSIDWTRIEKTDEIRTLALQQLLDLEDLFPGRIIRDPLTPADSALGYTAGPIREVDRTSVNVAATTLEAYDFQIDYDVTVAGLGEFHFYGVATLQPFLRIQAAANSPFVNSVGFDTGPLEFRGNFGLDWRRGPVSAGWSMQYYDSYRPYTATALANEINAIVTAQGADRIPSQTYHDFYLSYRFDDAPGSPRALAGTTLALGVQNLFDADPPVIATIATNGGYSTYGDPRLRRFTISLEKSF